MARLYLLASTILLVMYLYSGLFPVIADSASVQDGSPSSVKLAMWEYAPETGKPDEIDRFFDLFPASSFFQESALIKAAFTDDSMTGKTQSVDSVQDAEIVTFDQPLDTDTVTADRRLIKRLIDGNPTFPPATDLPEKYWDGKDCGECRNWEKTPHCDQAKFFFDRDPGVTKRIKHPYGGFFKDALRRWAAGGCV